MGIELRKVRRSIEEKAEKAAIKDPLTGEQMELGEHAKSQEDIWQDPEEQAKFLQFFGAKDSRKAKPIIDALENKRLLTESQQTYVDESVRGYNTRRAEMGRLEQIFTPDYVRDIADTDKSVGLMVKQIGLERAHELLRGQLEKLSLDDAKSYSKLVKSMSEERTLSEGGWTAYVNNKVSHTLERIGIAQEDMGGYVASSLNMTTGFDRAARTRLESAARENMNIFMKIADSIGAKKISRGRAESFIDSFEKQRDLLQKSNLHLADIAKVLKASITPEMRKEMQRVMLEGGEMKGVPETNVNTIQELRAAREEFEEGAVKKRFGEALKAESKRLKKKSLSAYSPAEKSAFIDSFVDTEVTLQKKKIGRGIFTALLGIFLKSKPDIKTHAASLWP
ncbi:MAG: hypothetical protein ACYCZ0_04345 [Minisyncoccota bacterium]